LAGQPSWPRPRCTSVPSIGPADRGAGRGRALSTPRLPWQEHYPLQDCLGKFTPSSSRVGLVFVSSSSSCWIPQTDSIIALS
jgi:hypothetical protein